MGRIVTKDKVVGVGNENIKEQIRDYLTTNLQSLLDDIDQLPPKERVERRMKLMDFVLPKVQAVATIDAPSQSSAAAILDREAAYDDDE